MVKIMKKSDGTLEVSGNTFVHRETIKSLGATWKSTTKT